MKKRDMSLDFIRILAMALIVLFHFYSYFPVNSSWSLVFKNGTWGGLGTGIFFMISGYLLRSRYKGNYSIRDFYKKRWLSIYPAFYLAFLGSYIFMLVTGSSPFYGGPAYRLIYTVLGIDKYLNWYNIANYSTVGEWFTAVILVLYIIYPLLSNCLNRAKASFSVVILIIYLFMNFTGLFPLNGDISLINSLMMFWAGMWIADLGEGIRKRKWPAAIFAAAGLLLLLVEIPGPKIIMTHLLAAAMFLVIYILFPREISAKPVSGTIIFLAGLSYDIYLVHHFLLLVLDSLLKHFGFAPGIGLKLVIYILLTLGFGWLLNVITKPVVSLFKKK